MPSAFDITYVSDRTEDELRALWENFRVKEPGSFSQWVELHKVLKPQFGIDSLEYDEEYRSQESMIANYIRTYIYPEIFDYTQVEKQIARDRSIYNLKDDMKLYYHRYMDDEEFWEGK